MSPRLRQAVQRRAEDCCEYCSLPQSALSLTPFHVEHIVPKQHGGAEVLENLAFSCDRCNAYKGPNLSAIDPKTRKTVLLFNPRTQKWDKHFRAVGAQIQGLTAIGRATVTLLNMNAHRRLALRATLNR